MNDRTMNDRRVVDCNRCRVTIPFEDSIVMEVEARLHLQTGAPEGYPRFESWGNTVSADLCATCHEMIEKAVAKVMATGP